MNTTNQKETKEELHTIKVSLTEDLGFYEMPGDDQCVYGFEKNEAEIKAIVKASGQEIIESLEVKIPKRLYDMLQDESEEIQNLSQDLLIPIIIETAEKTFGKKVEIITE